jgi:hypothetical protein
MSFPPNLIHSLATTLATVLATSLAEALSAALGPSPHTSQAYANCKLRNLGMQCGVEARAVTTFTWIVSGRGVRKLQKNAMA